MTEKTHEPLDWRRAPIGTHFGGRMMEALLELSNDATATIYAHQDEAHLVAPALQHMLAGPAGPMSLAERDVIAERRRQVDVEGWAPEHDDEHSDGSMAKAAACYALQAAGVNGDDPAQLRFWPWGDEWWRPGDARRNLVKAGALILAEIERLDRAAKQAGLR